MGCQPLSFVLLWARGRFSGGSAKAGRLVTKQHVAWLAGWFVLLVLLFVCGTALSGHSGAVVHAQTADEDELVAEVARLSEELRRLEEEANLLDWSLADVRTKLVAKQEELAAVRQELDALKALLWSSLRALYQYGRGAVPQALVSPEGIEQLGLRLRYRRCFINWQARQVEEFRERLRVFGEMVGEVEEAQARVESLRDKLLAKKREVLKENLSAQLALEELHQDAVPGEMAQWPAEGREAASEFWRAGSSPPFAERKGHLPWPVDAITVGYYNYVKPGEMGAGGEKSDNRGIEVEAGEEDVVFAVAEGRVLFAGPLRGYGRLVILDHGDNYYSLYGYLHELFVELGQQVGTGELLGILGVKAAKGEPKLYFEIRHYGQPEDPLTWLEQLTPDNAAALVAAPAGHAR